MCPSFWSQMTGILLIILVIQTIGQHSRIVMSWLGEHSGVTFKKTGLQIETNVFEPSKLDSFGILSLFSMGRKLSLLRYSCPAFPLVRGGCRDWPMLATSVYRWGRKAQERLKMDFWTHWRVQKTTGTEMMKIGYKVGWLKTEGPLAGHCGRRSNQMKSRISTKEPIPKQDFCWMLNGQQNLVNSEVASRVANGKGQCWIYLCRGIYKIYPIRQLCWLIRLDLRAHSASACALLPSFHGGAACSQRSCVAAGGTGWWLRR